MPVALEDGVDALVGAVVPAASGGAVCTPEGLISTALADGAPDAAGAVDATGAPDAADAPDSTAAGAMSGAAPVGVTITVDAGRSDPAASVAGSMAGAAELDPSPEPFDSPTTTARIATSPAAPPPINAAVRRVFRRRVPLSDAVPASV